MLPSARWWNSARPASDHPFWLQTAVSAGAGDDGWEADGSCAQPARINDPAIELRIERRRGFTGQLYVPIPSPDEPPRLFQRVQIPVDAADVYNPVDDQRRGEDGPAAKQAIDPTVPASCQLDGNISGEFSLPSAVSRLQGSNRDPDPARCAVGSTHRGVASRINRCNRFTSSGYGAGAEPAAGLYLGLSGFCI